MTATDTTPLQAALTRIMADAGYVQKDAKNDHHKYRYASADAVLTKVREACAREGVSIVESRQEFMPGEGGLVTVRMTLVFAKGAERAEFSGLGSGKDGQDKAVMKANTAALKYLLASAFLISWGDDPEASEPDSGKATRPKASAPAPRGQQKAEPPPSTDTSDVEATIDGMTVETFEAVKAAIKATGLKGDAFTALVHAYNARKAAIVAEAEAAAKKTKTKNKGETK